MKTLLTFHDTEATLESIDSIAESAINMQAHLHVLAIGIATISPVSVYSQVPAYDYAATYSQVIKDTQQRTIELADYLKKMGVSATVVSVCDAVGSIASIAADSALFADYAIVPAPEPSKTGLDLRKYFLEGVMYVARTPAILLPASNNVVVNPIKRVVVGWHPSPNAAAAVRSCIPLLNYDTEVNLAIVDSSPATYGVSPGSEIATFLARHKINANIDMLSSNSKPIGKLLIQHSIDKNADLLVIGAYGRSRFKEWLMGGTTRDIFESLTIPTLVSH